MTLEVREALIAARDLQIEREELSPWVFPSPSDSSRSLQYDRAYKWLVQCCNLAGIVKPKHGGFHCYRRNFATESSSPDHVIRQLAGWETQQSLDRYRHLNRQELEGAVDAPRTRVQRRISMEQGQS